MSRIPLPTAIYQEAGGEDPGDWFVGIEIQHGSPTLGVQIDSATRATVSPMMTGQD